MSHHSLSRIRWQAALASALLVAGCATTPPPRPPAVAEPAIAEAQKAPAGAINEDVTQANIQQTICVPGWTATVRPSTSYTYTNGLKAKLLGDRGLPSSDAAEYELDHLIPLALGGHPRKPENQNLWLQPWDGTWGAKTKDRLEVKLKTLVCRGKLTLQSGRDAVARDWIAAFKKYVSRDDPVFVEPTE